MYTIEIMNPNIYVSLIDLLFLSIAKLVTTKLNVKLILVANIVHVRCFLANGLPNPHASWVYII